MLVLIVVILIAIGGYFYFQSQNSVNVAQNPGSGEQTPTTTAATTTPTQKPQESIGKSVSGQDIVAYHFGTGNKEILLVGGIHGGYEWNTALVAYQIIDQLRADPSAVPANLTVTVIPVVNPDGLRKVVDTTGPFAASDVNESQAVQVSGRFNSNTVDLNRNFDCDWQSSGVWQTKKVSGGTAAFSEPESQAIKAYVESHKPAAVIVWYSSAGGVFSSNCHSGVLPETNLMNQIFSKAAGYPSHEVYDYYATTGDMTNWLTKIGTPAISVLLTNHTDTELSKNTAGVNAILQHFAQ